MNAILTGALTLLLVGCGPSPAPSDTTLVISSDPDLRAAVAALLPDLLRRSGLSLRDPVRVERRSRGDLERYLVAKLDEELPPAELAGVTRSYALLGLVPEDLDLRGLLLSVYTEQVAGFYDPDSTALFVLDDMPAETMTPLLVHELVHAVQDQATDLDSITHRDLGNDRQAAAQAAIEGHATLVMFEHVTSEVQGRDVDLSEIPGFASRVRPALEAMRTQYPALANAPAVVRESVLFPYLEGAGFVQALWEGSEGRPAPFSDHLPLSTEQVLHPERFIGERDSPTRLAVAVPERSKLYENGLGEFETRILLGELVGPAAVDAASGWDGDAYALLDGSEDALVWAVVWDDEASRDRFVRTLAPGLGSLPRPATLAPLQVDGRPGAILRVGAVGDVVISIPGEGGG